MTKFKEFLNEANFSKSMIPKRVVKKLINHSTHPKIKKASESEIYEEVVKSLQFDIKDAISKISSQKTPQDAEDFVNKAVAKWINNNRGNKDLVGQLLQNIFKPDRDTKDLKEDIVKSIVNSKAFQKQMDKIDQGDTLESIKNSFSRKYSEFQTEIDGKTLIFSTREHGDVSEGTPGKEDIKRAKALAKDIQNKYDVDAKVETTDEFVEVKVK